jgi:hypothetical protein
MFSDRTPRRYTQSVAKRAKRQPREVIRLTLDAAATPERVRDLAKMFAETLRLIRPDMADGEVTMVVHNFTSDVEARGWDGDGGDIIKLFGDLVDNPTEAIQANEELASAARTLANHAAELVQYRPVFWRDKKELRVVDDVFVRTMRAAGAEATKAVSGSLTGDTIVYSPVLRVGRNTEGGKVKARVRLDGRFIDVEVVDDDLVPDLFEAAKTGKVCQIRLHGQWAEDGDGGLTLRSPEVVAVDLDYAPWSGRKILEAARELAPHFTTEDFDRMLRDLQSED